MQGLKELRKEKGYTQESLSRLLDISLRHYINIEHNKVNPSIKIAIKISKILETNCKEIWESEKPNQI